MSRNLAVFAAICLAACTTTNSARAEFIIDSFNAGETLTLPGGVSVTRTISGTFTENGTDVTFDATSSPVTDIVYTLGGGATFADVGDLLGGTPALKLDFLSNTSTDLDLRWQGDGGAFSAPIAVAASASPFSLAFSTPGLLSFNTLALRLVSFNGGSFTLDRLTATPEPSTFAMVGLALVGGGVVYRRRKAQAALAA